MIGTRALVACARARDVLIDVTTPRRELAQRAGGVVADGEHLDDAASHGMGQDLEGCTTAVSVATARSYGTEASTAPQADRPYQLTGSALPSS